MDSVKVFNDNVKSKLRELYTDINAIYECRPRITLPSGRVVAVNELEDGIKNAVPNYRETPMVIDVEPSITYEAVERVTKSLLSLSKSKESCCVKIIKISNFKNIMFKHAILENEKLRPPCFKIEVPACLPNTVQNINTGYIIDICTEIENYQVANGAIVRSARCYPQKKMVIVPQILTKDKNIVPQLCARDYDDSGPYTISMLNRTGDACTVFVYLYAYKCVLPHASLRFENHEDLESKVLKAKDSRPGRYIYNFSTGVLFDTGVVSDDKCRIDFSCFDVTKTGHDALLSARVVMDNLCVFFSTRKREWCDPKLFTISGLFRPGKDYIAPSIAQQSQYNTNTHGCVFMDSRMTLFTTAGTLNSRHLLINGSMFDLPKYKILKRARSAFVRDLYLLRSGTVSVKRFDEHEYNRDDLMLLYDYQVLTNDDDFVKRTYGKRNNESELFKCSNNSIKRTISSRLYKNMMLLTNHFVLQKTDELEDGSVSTTTSAATITTDIGEPSSKRPKLD